MRNDMRIPRSPKVRGLAALALLLFGLNFLVFLDHSERTCIEPSVAFIDRQPVSLPEPISDLPILSPEQAGSLKRYTGHDGIVVASRSGRELRIRATQSIEDDAVLRERLQLPEDNAIPILR